MTERPVLDLQRVTLIRGDRQILDSICWQVRPTERWVILGPNGSGKTSLCRVASLYQHPTRGTVDLLGERLGRVDVRMLRSRLGFTSAALTDMLKPSLRVADVVVTGKFAALAPHWHRYTLDDRDKADRLLERFGCQRLGAARFGTLSSGERQRVLLARVLMNDPSLLLLDEPTAGLDLGGREQLIHQLATLAQDPAAPAIIMVTHHVDEIPRGFTHGLLLRAGRIVASGAIDDTLTPETLSSCFDMPLSLERRRGRWAAWVAS